MVLVASTTAIDFCCFACVSMIGLGGMNGFFRFGGLLIYCLLVTPIWRFFSAFDSVKMWSSFCLDSVLRML